jgi:hypothetical protein
MTDPAAGPDHGLEKFRAYLTLILRGLQQLKRTLASPGEP